MNKTEYNEIVIDWKKPFIIDNENDNKLENIEALYQIYGDHHIYGRDILLYIGISQHCEKRINQHLKDVFGYVNNLKISIGEIENNKDLKIAESILIANHKPSFNKNHINDLIPEAKNEKIIIINNGNNLMLKTCCTNYWWVDHLLKEPSYR